LTPFRGVINVKETIKIVVLITEALRKMERKIPQHMTLNRFLVQQQHAYPGAAGELTAVMDQLGTVGKIISSSMRRIALDGLTGLTGGLNVQGEEVRKLDELGNTIFIEAFEYVDIVGAVVSEEMDEPLAISSGGEPGKYVVLVDPIDGSSNLDVDCVIGSIFSIRNLKGSVEESILQKGTGQVAAGYIMYGTSTLLVYTAGDGVHIFVLDEQIGEFVLTHDMVRMPAKGTIMSSNFGNYQRWADPVKRFAGTLAREETYSLRYSGALVADLHQILHKGGIYLYPEDDKRPEGKLRLLYECAPLAMIAEQAGGGATNGKARVMEIAPGHAHQRVPFAIGSPYEIGKYEEFCRG
jgi:fructose-1,6-bisphosphatase I